MIRNYPNALSSQSGEADHNVFSKVAVDFVEGIGIDDIGNDLLNIIRLVRIVRYDVLQPHAHFIARLVSQYRRLLIAVLREVAQQSLEAIDQGYFIGVGKMRHPAFGSVGTSTAQFL